MPTRGAYHAGCLAISKLIAPLPPVFSVDSDSRPNPARKRTTKRCVQVYKNIHKFNSNKR